MPHILFSDTDNIGAFGRPLTTVPLVLKIHIIY